MKPTLKAAVAGLLTAGIAGGGILAVAGTAFAAQSAPPWEPDGNAASYGNVVFYNAIGQEVTSGTNDLSSPFAYAVAGTAADSGATKATVNFYNPQPGVLPANWTGTSEAGTTTFTALPGSTPADIAAYAPTNPVAATPTANISTWLGSNTPSGTTGYANTIEVRLTDSGPLNHGNAPGTYWESDIGYNTTGTAITVDGTTVPANGWALLAPFTKATTTMLATTAPGGYQQAGQPITLTATVPSNPSGAVEFFDGSTLIDTTAIGTTFQYTYDPTVGSHSYTATFVPHIGDETNAHTNTATILGGSTSSAVTVGAVSPYQITVNGKPTTQGVPGLALTKTSSLKISGSGWDPGDPIIVSLCNSDATMPDPSGQLEAQASTLLAHGTVTTDACAPVTEAGNVTVVGSKGTFTETITANPGKIGNNALSVCPQDFAQAQEGVNCVVGVAELSTSFAPTGHTANEAVYFAAPNLTVSDNYQSGTGAAAQYTVQLADNLAFQQSNDPAVTAQSYGAPNNGGFATEGVICTNGTASGCVVSYASPGVPTSCQASSTPGATPWGGETLCTYAAAVGEPVQIEILSYNPELTGATNPYPIKTPLNCDAEGCTVSASASAASSDPGGFATTTVSSVSWNGSANVATPIDFPPGNFTFEAVGFATGVTAKGTAVLLVGPAS